MCILMGKRLAVFLNSFPLLQSFLGLKMKKQKNKNKKQNNNNNKQTNDFLKDKNAFESSFFFIKLTFR